MASLFATSTMLLSIFLAMISIIPTSVGVKVSQKDIKQLCSKTINPSECLKHLESNPRTRNTDLHGLTEESIELAYRKAKEIHSKLNSLHKKYSKDKKMRYRYFQCSKNYNDAVRDLFLAKKCMKSGGHHHKLVPVEIKDALQEVRSCMNAYKGAPRDPGHINQGNVEFKLLCGMADAASAKLFNSE